MKKAAARLASYLKRMMVRSRPVNQAEMTQSTSIFPPVCAGRHTDAETNQRERGPGAAGIAQNSGGTARRRSRLIKVQICEAPRLHPGVGRPADAQCQPVGSKVPGRPRRARDDDCRAYKLGSPGRTCGWRRSRDFTRYRSHVVQRVKSTTTTTENLARRSSGHYTQVVWSKDDPRWAAEWPGAEVPYARGVHYATGGNFNNEFAAYARGRPASRCGRRFRR
uniref:SCP domain-containing protein n=1 Tax=Macrostomum lignano TaxID=282301 RepID=A0A1I8F604_9PLAT